jgi:predicted nucleic acid-binding protein
MVAALFDTNILIDHLNRVPQALAELKRFEDRAISVVTWMEVMVGVQPQAEAKTRSFLSAFTVVDIDAQVAEQAVKLRRAARIRLPDAIIWASALAKGRLLVTRNTKDFPASDPGIRIPYVI